MGTLRKPGRMSRRKRLRVTSRKVAVPIVLCIVAMIAIGLVTFLMRQRAGLPPGRMPRRIPPYYESVDRARPLPRTMPPSAFGDPKVARGYEIAERIPEILVQQPSYCAYWLRKHQSLLHCFVTEDAAHCPGCLQEAYLVDSLTRAGKSATYIRGAIIAGEWWSVKLE